MMSILTFVLLCSLTVPDSGRYVFYEGEDKLGYEQFVSKDGKIVSHVELEIRGLGKITMDAELRTINGILDTYTLTVQTQRGVQHLTAERVGKKVKIRFTAPGITKSETLRLADIRTEIVDNNIISLMNVFVQKFKGDSAQVFVPQAMKLITIRKLEDGWGELVCDGKNRVVRKITIAFDNRMRQELYMLGDTLALVYQPLGKIKISLDDRFDLPERKPGFKRKKFSVKSDGVKIKGEIDLPKKVKPKALIVMIAGSGPVDRHELGIFDDLAQCLTDSGYAVVRYDKRGTGKSGGKYEDIGLKELVDDAIAVAEYARSKEKDLPVFVFGHSEGGMIAFLVAKAVGADGLIALAAPCRKLPELLAKQLVRMGFVDSSQLDSISEALMATIDSLVKEEQLSGMAKLPIGGALPAKWLKEHALLEPDTLPNGWDKPTILIAGSDDKHVLPTDVEPFYKILKSQGVDVQFVVLEGQNHFFEDRDALCKTVVNWLKSH